jgi:hypothetical protein
VRADWRCALRFGHALVVVPNEADDDTDEANSDDDEGECDGDDS